MSIDYVTAILVLRPWVWANIDYGNLWLVIDFKF